MVKHPGNSAATLDRPQSGSTATAAKVGTWSGIGVIGYLGGATGVLAAAIQSLIRPQVDHETVLAGIIRQVDRLVGLSYGMVAFFHVGMGSFLAMQAYFGATFVDGIGPVVGVSLIRNLAPLLVGFLLAILTAVLFTADLQGLPAGPMRQHEVAVRVLAAMVAGPLLTAWGCVVGVVIGWLVARNMLGISEPMFFDLFLEMLWARDIIGLIVKGIAFGGLASVLACHEALRPTRAGERPGELAAGIRSASRGVVLASLAILAFNAAWFVFVYHAGPAFGPTLLIPPER